MEQERLERRWLAAEEEVLERTDPDGTRWRKVYVGGGAHLRNWLSQCQELSGEENVKLEKIEGGALACFRESGEGLFRIWIKEAGGSPLLQDAVEKDEPHQ